MTTALGFEAFFLSECRRFPSTQDSPAPIATDGYLRVDASIATTEPSTLPTATVDIAFASNCDKASSFSPESTPP